MAVKRFGRTASYIFTWAGDEPLIIRYDARTFVVPPRDETARTDKPGTIYRCESARDSTGGLIPGTIVVTDEVIDTEAGGYKKTFDVVEFCEFLTRQREELFNIGFNIVADVVDARAAIEAARPLYERSLDRSAEATLQAELERQQRYKEKGQATPPASNSDRVKKAISHLRAREHDRAREVVNEVDLRAALEGRTIPESVQRVAPATETEQAPIPKNGPVVKASPIAIYQEAVELGCNLSKRELEGLLGGDQEMVEFVVEKLKARREESPAKATA
jgi:hypothetical protein